MSKMNLLIDLKGYTGDNANSCRSNFNKNTQIIGLETSEEIIQEVTVAASSTVLLFDVTGSAKKLIYLESTKECDIVLNGTTEDTINPLVVGTSIFNGVYLKSSSIETVSVINNGLEDLKIYYVTVR